MSLLTVLLSIILVLNSVFLMLLILIQLPKKEAGAGLAFGAGATDALFGAGSGNALTKVTKYTATVFLALVLVLAVLGQRIANQSSTRIEQELQKHSNIPPALPLPGPNAVTNSDAAALTNILLKTTLPTNSSAPATATPAAPTTPPAEPQK